MPARDDSDSVRIAHGPLALERRIERDVRDEHALVRADPARLRSPILIVVPSRSLRAHFVRRLAAWCGGAAAGWRVVTLFGFARELCAASRTAVPRGSRLFEPLVDRVVARARELGPELTGYEDGPRAAAATIADLVDAGFVPELAPELLARLDACVRSRSITSAEGVRARALVAIAADLVREADALGVARSAQMLRCAERAIEADAAVVRARAVWIHGFADATGAAAGLLAALRTRAGARVYWDACANEEFGRALRKRLSIDARSAAHVDVPTCTLERASSIDVETRCVADRVRALLDSGLPAESIGIVARDLGPYRIALRRHFERLSIPFSGQSASAPDGPAERRARALAECISKGADVAVDRWLDARAEASFSAHRARPYELRIALRALGLATLSDVADLDVDTALAGRPSLALPLRGITTVEDCDVDDEGDSPGENEEEPAIEATDARAVPRRVALSRRSVARADLMREVEMAKASMQALDAQSVRSTVVARSQQLRSLAIDVLGWTTDGAEMRILDETIAALAADLPVELALDDTVLRALIEREISARSARPIGGAGGGVACLNVVEARARTFDTLFVMGLVRGRFPRNVREDPLLSDIVRSAWTDVLEHLPVKSVGRDEERVLFDQLVRSAPDVHLSWTTLDADNKALLPSPLLERVATHAAIAAVPLASDPLTHVGSESRAVRPAHEHAVSAALQGRIDGLASVLPIAVRETRAQFGIGAVQGKSGTDVQTTCANIAAARIAILREHEPRQNEPAALGPYFGLIGKLAARNDLRFGDLHVTQLEAIAACGWKALLTRVLRIEPPLDPLDALPDLDARLVGDVVHVVLQRVVEGMRGPPRWPAPDRVEEHLRHAAHAALRERGTFVPGFETLVATRARPMLDAARALDEDDAHAIRSARSEVNGGIDLPDGALGPRRLLFRADRVDEVNAGDEEPARWTDYKTGKPISAAIGADTRAKHLLNAIARGEKLQGMAYALGAGPSGSGRYVFLREEVDADKRVYAVSADDERAADAFHDALERIIGALDMGVLFPRLLGVDTHRTNGLCARCEMAQACLRGDSGANLRLARFVRSSAHADVTQQAALDLWSLSSAEAGS